MDSFESKHMKCGMIQMNLYSTQQNKHKTHDGGLGSFGNSI